MVRNAIYFSRSWFGSANVHSTVKQARISRNDFPTQALCQLQRYLSFPNRSWANDYHQGLGRKLK
jgi:hypothetical protein